jgi:hypothetical protein
LIIADAAFFPSSKLVRSTGVLELVAASAAEDHFKSLGKGAFTRLVAGLLRLRFDRSLHKAPFSAAELHSQLVSEYPNIVHDRSPGREVITSFPTPFHTQLGNVKIPSILLNPMQRPPRFGPEYEVTVTFRLSGDPFDADSWAEWLRNLPDGVKEAKVVDSPKSERPF